MAVQTLSELIKKEKLAEEIYKFSIKAPQIAKIAKPGQFIEIRVADRIVPILRRPISIYNIEKDKGIVEFIFQVKGEGTKILSNKEEGDKIDIIGPLGKGTFNYENLENIAIIGGGIGVFPLYELAKNASKTSKVNTYLGFRNKNFVVLEKEFRSVSNNLIITTDDGTYGEKGFAIEFLRRDIKEKNIQKIFACGPLPMLKSVQELAEKENIECEISLEERMACGMGVCLGCTIKVKQEKNFTYLPVCKYGPVFNSKIVEI